MAEADVFFLVATLIATVSFSAAFTLPGGNCGPNQGTVVLTRKAAVRAFTITNSVAMISSTYAIFLYSLTKRLKDINQLIMIASGAMMLAFTSATHAVAPHSLDLAISLCVICCFGYYYPLPLKGNLEKMRNQVDRLEDKRFRVQGQVDATTRNRKIVIGDVGAGLTSMNQKEVEEDVILENKGKARKGFLDNWGLNLRSWNWLSRKAMNRPRELLVIHKGESQRVVQCRPVLDIVHTPPTPLCRHFTFAEIQSATHDFDNAFVIGKGGFGKVYKGSIDNGSSTVAIKRLDPLSKQGGKEFWTEVGTLSKFRHSHVVSLIGYCDNCDDMILVYEYMHNGSMADHLHKKNSNRNVNTPTLCWVQRLKICIGAARGLDYLHTGTGFLQRVIHRDVKSSNILLDENWAAKISDFGLSKIAPANQSCTHVSTCVKGTRGYIDPDYFLTHRLTRKSDVYAFGVVLFEVLSGRQALDSRLPGQQRGLVGWTQHCIREDKVHTLIDPNLKWEIFPNSLKEFVKIANQCLHGSPKKRPTMSEVVASLESALALQERKDSSILDDYDFDFGGICDDQEKARISSVQLEVIDAGSGAFKPECIATTNDADTLTGVECMPKDDQGHQGHGGCNGVDEKAASMGDATSGALSTEWRRKKANTK